MKTRVSEEEEKLIASKLINNIAKRLLIKNKNFIVIIVGETGSGKSESAISFCYLVEKAVCNLLKNEKVRNAIKKRGVNPEEIKINPDEIYKRIVFDGKGFMNLTNTEEIQMKGKKKYKPVKLCKGNMILWDEAGAGEMDNQTWQNKVSIAINHIFQTFRSDNIGVVLTVPFKDWVNKKVKQLAHSTMETITILHRRKRCKLKWLFHRKNHRTGDIIDVYPRVLLNGRKLKIERVLLPRPPRKIRNRYIDLKEEFNYIKKQQAKEKIDEMENENAKKGNLTFSEDDIERIVKEIVERADVLCKEHRGQIRIPKQTIEGLYNCSSRDASKIKALVELKLNETSSNIEEKEEDDYISD